MSMLLSSRTDDVTPEFFDWILEEYLVVVQTLSSRENQERPNGELKRFVANRGEFVHLRSSSPLPITEKIALWGINAQVPYFPKGTGFGVF